MNSIFAQYNSFQTNHLIFNAIDIDDAEIIIKIRNSNKKSVLKPISYSMQNQKIYISKYLVRHANEEEIYYKVKDRLSNTYVGLVRITELDYKYKFNWQSLIFAESIKPYFVIDAIVALYYLGFEVFEKMLCGPWEVPLQGHSVYKLHKKMNIATEIGMSKDAYIFIVTREEFVKKFNFFKKLGFGIIR
jgi:hypothetical protein